MDGTKSTTDCAFLYMPSKSRHGTHLLLAHRSNPRPFDLVSTILTAISRYKVQNIKQCVRTNGMHPNGSRDLFNIAYELMCVILKFHMF